MAIVTGHRSNQSGQPVEKRFSEFFGIYEINLVVEFSHHTQKAHKMFR